ncbi:S24 family peptidase [Accumulibacter sp.]|uniref:XRE family transcriptional regulator n=1 Tax=Accumulibacter sp. TaxID=2053492 RepID=UPI0025E2D380|nr:S24 family peptidase [Accumulibacter sp.]MCM8595155.1 helix-turn-helix domain-containing protein [Accumulibacter sp.]MCM8626182.1 helix-turn-helix domain-containing protein [Accumulibacter sp.]MDS4049301.1 S24 family peptidase [Accumulibacter sp.]
MSIGAAIRLIRKRKALTLQELSARAGTDTGNLSRIERGLQGVSGELLDRLAQALGVRPSDIHLEAEGILPSAEVAADKYVMIPRLSLQVAAGNGQEPEHVEVQNTLAFRREWLRSKGLDQAHLEVYEASGDSMAPYIQNGDLLLVDVSATPPKSGEVWVLWQAAPLGVRVKRILYRENGDIIIRSDNADKMLYPDEIIPGHQGETVSTVGKVVWRGG